MSVNAFNGTIILTSTVAGVQLTDFFTGIGGVTGGGISATYQGTFADGSAANAAPQFAPLSPYGLPVATSTTPGAISVDNLSSVADAFGKLHTGLYVQGAVAAVVTVNITGGTNVNDVVTISGNSLLVVDGYTPIANDKLLLTNQSQILNAQGFVVFPTNALNGTWTVSTNRARSANIAITVTVAISSATNVYMSNTDIAKLSVGLSVDITAGQTTTTYTISSIQNTAAPYYAALSGNVTLTVGQSLNFYLAAAYALVRSDDNVVFGGIWRISSGTAGTGQVWINNTTALILVNRTPVTYSLFSSPQSASSLQFTLAAGNTANLGLSALSLTAGYSQANQLTLTGSSAGNSLALTASGTDTDVSIALLPKGGGSLSIGTTAGTSPLKIANAATGIVTLSEGTAGQIVTSAGPGRSPYWGPAPITSPAGSDTQIQVNTGGIFGASPSLTFNGTTLGVTGTVQATSLSATTGSITTAPVNANDIARLADVTAATAGFKPQGSVAAVAISSVGDTFTSTSPFVGWSTLTGVAPLQIDGYRPAVGDKVLLTNQAAINTYAAKVTNGTYDVSANPNNGRFTLTRVSNSVVYGNTWIVSSGTSYANSVWENITTGTITVDTTALIYTQFSPAFVTPTLDQVLTAGSVSAQNVSLGNITVGNGQTNTIVLAGSSNKSSITTTTVLVLDGTGVQIGGAGTTALLAATSSTSITPTTGTVGQVLTSNGADKTPYWSTPTLTPPAGANGQLQYYLNAAFGASSKLSWLESVGLVIGNGANSNTVTLLPSTSTSAPTTFTNYGTGGYRLISSALSYFDVALGASSTTLTAINSNSSTSVADLNLSTQAGVINLKAQSGGADLASYLRVSPVNSGSPSIGVISTSTDVALQLFGQGAGGIRLGQLASTDPLLVPNSAGDAWNAGTSGQLLASSGAGVSPKWINPPVTVVPGGSTGQIQYNNAGAFAGSSYLTWSALGGLKLNYYDAGAASPAAGPTLTIAPPQSTTTNATFTLGDSAVGGFAWVNTNSTQLSLVLGDSSVRFNAFDTGASPVARDLHLNAYMGSIVLGATSDGSSEYASELKITPSNSTSSSSLPVKISIATSFTDNTLVIDGAGAGGISLGTAGTTPVLALAAATGTTYGAGTAGQVLTSKGAGKSPYWGAPALTPAAGANLDLQFNNSGSFAGSDNLQYNNGTNKLTVINLEVTGAFLLPTTPAVPTQVARLADVQYATAGFKPQGTVAAIATSSFGTTFTSTSPFLGASTLSGTGTLTIDGVTPTASSKVLLTAQEAIGTFAAKVTNGAYTVTDNGSALGTWTLTRASEIPLYGNTWLASGGTAYANSVWENITSDVTITPDTTPLIYAQFSAPFTTPNLSTVLSVTSGFVTDSMGVGAFSAGRNGVNYIQLQGNSAGNKPSIFAAGADTNITLQLQGKNSGGLQLGGTSGLDPIFISPTAGATSYTPSAGTAGQVFTSNGTGKSPYWSTPNTGTVTSISLSTAMGGAFSVTNGSTSASLGFTSSAAAGKYLDGSGAWVALPFPGTGTVTSLQVTVPSPLAVTPSTAITTNGTYAITWGTGQIPVANLGTNTATALTYLNGENAWINPVAGATSQIQYNSAGALAATSNFTWDATNGLTLLSSTSNDGLRIIPNPASNVPQIAAVGNSAVVDLLLTPKGVNSTVYIGYAPGAGPALALQAFVQSGQDNSYIRFGTTGINTDLRFSPSGTGLISFYGGGSGNFIRYELGNAGYAQIDTFNYTATQTVNLQLKPFGTAARVVALNAFSLGVDQTTPTPLFAGDAVTQTAITAGTTGQVLTSAGSAKTPYWQTVVTSSALYTSAGRNDQSWTATTAVTAVFTGTNVTGSVYRYYRTDASNTQSVYYRFVPTTDNTNYATGLSYDSFWSTFTGTSGGTGGTLSGLLVRKGQF